MLIREINMEDADQLVRLIKEVEASSKYMLMEAGERKITTEQQKEQIELISEKDNSTILVADNNGKLVGYMFAIGGNAKRTKHAVYLVIGIEELHRGMGIGTALFQKIEEWARKNHVSRLELTVVTENEAGVALYKKCGFEIEGTKRNSLLISEKFYHEYYMSKLL